MKETITKILVVVLDFMTIMLSITASFFLRKFFDPYFSLSAPKDLSTYLNLEIFYGIIFLMLYWEGIYTKRFDFWQETKQISRALLIAFLLVFSILALQHETNNYSRFILTFTFLFMFVLFPIQKFIIKRYFFKIGLWQREAFVLGNDPLLRKDVFNNPYLGYIQGDVRSSKTVFIASDSQNIKQIETILDDSVKYNQEIIFIPLIKSYDFSDSYIIHLFNAQTNLVVLENKLLSRFKQWLKSGSDYLLSLFLFPFTLCAMLLITYIIKREEPRQKVIFMQIRMGYNGRPFVCYKFRTMRENSNALLEEYLKHHPDELVNYALYHKYDNDPRVTKIGKFLRKTSLDELPQIFNVLRGEMSLIGPRPYMVEERHKMGKKRSLILAVKPGITGLWQVSGRSNLNFNSRLELDSWYVRNWSLWTDFVILIKTIKVVFKQEGAI